MGKFCTAAKNSTASSKKCLTDLLTKIFCSSRLTVSHVCPVRVLCLHEQVLRGIMWLPYRLHFHSSRRCPTRSCRPSVRRPRRFCAAEISCVGLQASWTRWCLYRLPGRSPWHRRPGCPHGPEALLQRPIHRKYVTTTI